MSHILAVVDSDGNFIEGCVGFYDKKHLKKRFPDETIIRLLDEDFPKDFDVDCCYIKDERFTRKTDEEIEAILLARNTPKKSPYQDELLAIDTNGVGEFDLKIVIQFLQGRHGV